MTGPKSWWFGALPHAEVFLFVMGDWMFMLYSCSAGVQMLKNGCGCLCCMVVQHVMMYPNAQKWVWMFMLSSCSAGSQMLRQVNITEGSGLPGT